MTLRFHLLSLAFRAPGLADWERARPVLAGDMAWVPDEVLPSPPSMLPAAERRRTGPFIRLALETAAAAAREWGGDAEDLPVVFASYGGDLEVVHSICHALSLPDRPVSPVKFHNSVHNAVVGYWAIGMKSRQPATAISAGPHGFVNGLVEAALQALDSDRPVMYLCAEYPAPEPLAGHADHGGAAAFAMILATSAGRPIMLEEVDETHRLTPVPPGLQDLARLNAVTHAVPLLRALASPEPAEIVMQADSGVRWRFKVGER